MMAGEYRSESATTGSPTAVNDMEADRQAELALGRGDLLLTLDITGTAIAAGGLAPGLGFKHILALARMGDTQRALDAANRIGLTQRNDEDSLALWARILKDIALGAPDRSGTDAILAARAAYDYAHAVDGGYFSAINAASLSMLAGEKADAAARATRIMRDPHVARPTDYYAAATEVEALLLLDRAEEAMSALEVALACADADMSKRASTLRQFERLAQAVSDPNTLAPVIARLRPPPVLYFAGHLFRPDASAEAAIRAQIDVLLDSMGICIGYGAPAAGADLLFAEALLDRGADLTLVLPFAGDDFIRQSILPFGEAWLPRFEAVLGRARRVAYASDSTFAGDLGQFTYGNEYAMGLACLRADHLCARAVNITVLEAEGNAGTGGAGATIARWQETGRDFVVIDPGSIDRTGSRTEPLPNEWPEILRENRAIIFTDYAGFSKLDEQALPIFWREVMGRVGAVLNERRDSILFCNTWGDALYAIVADPLAAADIAMNLKDSLGAMDPVSVGMPQGAGMRIALHYGPLYRAEDHVTGGMGYFGTEVTRTARIEPITPVGEVYTTQSYAAFLALTADQSFRTSYVGTVPLAKAFGSVPMHRMERN